MIRAHLVTVLGREIPVRSSAPEEKVREVEAFVHSRINAIQERLSTADPQLLATLALLNLAESYLELQERQGGANPLDARLVDIISRLDNAL